MDAWIIWTVIGVALVVLELIIPGGITSFVGMAAIITGLLIKYEVLKDTTSVVLTFMILSIVLLLFLRTIFMKYFEGDSRKQNVDEDHDARGTIVDVLEDIHPFREGRVSFRGTGWQARSEEEITKGSKAVIIGRDGNIWIVKSI